MTDLPDVPEYIHVAGQKYQTIHVLTEKDMERHDLTLYGYERLIAVKRVSDGLITSIYQRYDGTFVHYGEVEP